MQQMQHVPRCLASTTSNIRLVQAPSLSSVGEPLITPVEILGSFGFLAPWTTFVCSKMLDRTRRSIAVSNMRTTVAAFGLLAVAILPTPSEGTKLLSITKPISASMPSVDAPHSEIRQRQRQLLLLGTWAHGTWRAQ
jgi:hypothetical protein